MPEVDTPPERLREQLAAAGQTHLLAHAESLPPPDRDALLAQIDAINLDALPALIDAYVRTAPADAVPTDLQPAPYYPRTPGRGSKEWDESAMRDAGEALLRAGKVACFTVAGGQGSRLGYDGPKGCFPAGCVTGKPLFQVFAEGIRATADRYGAPVPWYIMTSPLNHDATRAFFEQHDHFGLRAQDVTFFQQGTMPSFDKESAQILLADNSTLATNPDGHGGAVRALHASGATADMRARGVEHVSYFQVDNPHAMVADPVFLGLHAAAPDSSGEVSSKMIPKVSWDEKVGVFCAAEDRVRVIEYSDLPDELAKATDADGSLRFLAGSIAIHAFSVEFIDRLATDPAYELPFHRAVKKVAHLAPATGQRVEPAAPNAVKLERFIFDGVPLARSSIVYETDRVEEFAPIKNATGVDSVESSKRLQTERAARWLERSGVDVPRDASGVVNATIEISPLTALSPDQLAERDLPASIERGAEVVL